MRKSAEEKAKRRFIVTVIMGVLSFLGAVFLLLIIFAAISLKLDAVDSILSVMAAVILGAGCFAAAFVTANRRRKKGMLTGFLCCGIVFAVVLICGLLFSESFTAGGFTAKILLVFSCSGIGGILGVNCNKMFR